MDTLHRPRAAILPWLCWVLAAVLARPLSARPEATVLDPLTWVGEGEPLAPADGLKTLRLVVPRNGVASRQVVVQDAGGLAGLSATLGELRRADGQGVIPAAAVSVRYAAPARLDRSTPQDTAKFDALLDAPAKLGAIQPIWITVAAPAEARAGEYLGTLAIKTNAGAAGPVPVSVQVAPWTAPSPQQFTTHVGLIQSPEALAKAYKAAMWSPAHFALIEKSLRGMAYVGNKVVHVPLSASNQMGNQQGMIRFTKSAGGYSPDLAVVNTYLDLYAGTCGVPSVICVYAWDLHAGDRRGGPIAPVPMTLVDRAAGTTSDFLVDYSTPQGEAILKAAMDAVRASVLKRGWSEESIMIGVASDGRPGRATTDLFQRVAPYARWVINSHDFAPDINGVKVGYIAYVRAHRRDQPGWANPMQETWFPRRKGRGYWTLGMWRCVAEAAIVNGQAGVGRLGADVWPAFSSENQLKATWTPNLSLGVVTSALLQQGPQGPVPSVRLEMLREGLQESEARIHIERAIASPATKDALAPDLVKRAAALLRQRQGSLNKEGPPPGTAWQDDTLALFTLAGEFPATATTRPR